MSTVSAISDKKDKVTGEEETVGRRDFFHVLAASFGAVGGAALLMPLVKQMNPDRSVLALATVEVDLSDIADGETVTVKWQGKPIFIRNRTEEELSEVREVALSSLIDPQTDQERVKAGHDKWLVVLGNCTHLGCVPVKDQGEYRGWYCPCHASHYDVSGRIRKGPAPLNLPVPQYKFVDDSKIIIG